MKDQSKTKQALIQELISLRHRVSEQEQSESNASGRTQEEDLVPLLKQRLYLLIETIQKLAQVRDLEGIMGVVRSAARALVGSDGSTFVLREGGQCFYADEDAISPLWRGHRFPMSMCISGWVMMNHQIAVIKDIYADARIPAEAYRPTFVKSLTMVPIRSRDPLGAIGNYWAYLHSPTPEEVQLLQTLADATAIAMENVRLFNEHEQRLTERKRAEEALCESEKKYRNLVESVSDVIYEIDSQGVVIYVSPVIKDIMGYDQADITGKHFIEIVYKDDRNHMVERFSEPSKGIEYASDYRLISKSGDIRWVRTRTSPIMEGGSFKGSRGTLIDITERKRAEEELRHERNRAQGYIDTVETIIVALNNEGRITSINRKGCQILGYKEDELIGQHWFSACLPQPEGMEKVFPFFLRLINGEIEAAEYFENAVVTRSGDLRQMAWHNGLLRDEQGRVIGTISSGEDITERKQAEEEKRNLEERLHQIEKMEAIGTLAGGVAHDLNNMLGALIGHAELLKGDLRKTDPRLYNMAESIMTSGQKAAKVVQDLLTMARRGVVLKEPASLNKILAEQLKSSEIRNLLSSHSFVTIETKYDRDLLDINASSIHIERALTNLISNALRAMRGDGTLTIRTENHYLEGPLMAYETVPKGEYAVLSVSDTGIGILPEYMNKIFEPFFLRKVLKRGGSGLGLSVIWGTMKDHDGYIDVTSELGQGTTFSLYFPVTRDDTVRWVEHSVDDYRGYGETILVVDDEDLQCSVAEKMLTRLNYVVKTVESGEEALEYLADHDVDLIVLDMIIEPGMDGYDTYRRILEIKKRQKAIIFSGFTKTERVKMVQDLGAGEFIMKPYVMERLGIAVRKELDRK